MTTQQQQSEQQQTPPVIEIPGDAPPAPIDVDVEGGTATEVTPETPPVQRQAGETPPARTKPRPQQRIQTLTHERDQWQTTAQRLEAELTRARQEAAEAHVGRAQAERAGMENLVQRTKAEVSSATAALRAAKDAQDANAEVEAQKRLARAVAEEADADAWTAANPRQDPQQPQQRQPQQQQPQQQVQQPQALSGPVRDFMTENPWFSVVQIGNDGRPVVDQASGRAVSNSAFDPEMHDAAMIEHKKIQREVRTGKLTQDYIESPEYFERIRSRVATEFPDEFEQEAEEEAPPPPKPRTPPMKDARTPVAQSSRQVPTQGAPKQGTKLRLDGEQAGFVRSLVDNGTMLYPRNHSDPAKAGKKMSYEDAYVTYARQLAQNPPNNQQ